MHYATPDKHALQDVLVCIRHNTTLDEVRLLRRPNSEFYLKSPGQMAALFSQYPAALTNTLEVADRCQFELEFGLQDLPAFPTPDGITSEQYLEHLCQQFCLSTIFQTNRRQLALCIMRLKSFEIVGWQITF